MKQLVCEKWAGETIVVHSRRVAFDADGVCLGSVNVDDYGKMTLEDLPPDEVEYLLAFPYVHLAGEAPAPPAEMAVVAGGADIPATAVAPQRLTVRDLQALTYKELQALAAEYGISPVGMKKADLLDAIEAEA
jgi:hypothetical protein